MIKAVETTLGDLDYFKSESIIPDFENQMKANLLDPTKDIVSLVTESGKVIAFAGINHFRSGVAEAWIIRGEGINDHKFHFFKIIKRLVDYVIKGMAIHRFEIAISKEFKEGRKWAETLGFKYEHTAEAYDSNFIDHDIFVRITKWPREQQ